MVEEDYRTNGRIARKARPTWFSVREPHGQVRPLPVGGLARPEGKTVVNSTTMNSSSTSRRLILALAVFWLSGILVLHALALPDQPVEPGIRAFPVLISEQYCYGDAEVFAVWLRLSVKYTNHTNRKVILDRGIGKAWYGIKVARNLEDLSAGKYEYNPNIDWTESNEEKLKSDSPSRSFIVLAPGETFQSEINASVVAQYENSKNFAGAIKPGSHVLQLDLSAWGHAEDASMFAKSWRKFGDLVTGVVRTAPLEIKVPLAPNVEKNCK